MALVFQEVRYVYLYFTKTTLSSDKTQPSLLLLHCLLLYLVPVPVPPMLFSVLTPHQQHYARFRELPVGSGYEAGVQSLTLRVRAIVCEAVLQVRN